MTKNYSPEIAHHMRGYDPAKHIKALRQINKPQEKLLLYEVECLYPYQIKPHDVTTSRVELARCPHCGSPNIRTTLRFYELKRNGKTKVSRPVEEDPVKYTPPGSDEPTMIEHRIITMLQNNPVVTVEHLKERIWQGHTNKATIYAAVSRVRKKINGQIVMDRKAGGYRLKGNHDE